MNTKLKLMAVIVLTFSLSAIAESNGNGNGSGNANSGGSNGNGNGNANGGSGNGNGYGLEHKLGAPAFKEVSETNLQDTVNRMSDGKLGKLLISSGSEGLLGDKCDVKVDQYGSTLYTLLIPNSTVQKIGTKATPQVSVNLRQRNIHRLEKIPLPPASVEETVRTSDEIDVALKNLGSTFKSEIADRQWPCGATTAQSSNVAFPDLKSGVKFYLDEETGKTICVPPVDKETYIRKADSCDMEPMVEVLPDDLCKYVVHIVRNEMEDELQMAVWDKEKAESGDGDSASTPSNPGSTDSKDSRKKTREERRAERIAMRKDKQKSKVTIRYEKLDDQMKHRIRIAQYVHQDPEIVNIVNTMQMPTVDKFLNRETIDFIEDDSDEDADFETLPEDVQVELTRLALSVESVRGEADFVQPSANLQSVIEGFRPFADSIIENNPDMDINLYRFPNKSKLKIKIKQRLARLKDVTNQEYNTDLNCGGDDAVSVKPGKRMQRLLLKAKSRNGKIVIKLKSNTQTTRFSYTRQVPEVAPDREAARVARRAGRTN
ncbi:MAG: hypothetical protein ACJ76H_07770 [Bacteriovoracaceae bacterium]